MLWNAWWFVMLAPPNGAAPLRAIKIIDAPSSEIIDGMAA